MDVFYLMAIVFWEKRDTHRTWFSRQNYWYNPR